MIIAFWKQLPGKLPCCLLFRAAIPKKTVAVKTSGGDEKEIVNSFDKGSFLEALSKFNVINLSNSFKIDGYPKYEYEIRSGEPRKHIPHFHVLVDKKYSASVGLEKFEILASDVSKKKWIEVFSEAISLIEKNKEDYMDIWYYYHSALSQ